MEKPLFPINSGEGREPWLYKLLRMLDCCVLSHKQDIYTTPLMFREDGNKESEK